jgi:hypothetical protein
MGDHAGAPARFAAALGRDDADRLAVILEFDFRVSGKPARSRISAGMVACPFEVMRI